VQDQLRTEPEQVAEAGADEPMDGMKWSGPSIDLMTSHGRLAEKCQPRTNEEIGLKVTEAE
jgi:hypothetical protein